MFINGKYDPAAAIAEGARLGKELVADERIHTMVVLKRYDATADREAQYGVHGYGDTDVLGFTVTNTVGLMNRDYLAGLVEAVQHDAGWSTWTLGNCDTGTLNYIMYNIMPIEWHGKTLEVLDRVTVYTRSPWRPRPPYDYDDRKFTDRAQSDDQMSV